MWGDFLKNRMAQRLGVCRDFMNKVRQILYKIYHKEKHNKNKKCVNLHRKNHLLKNIRSKRHGNYYGFVKKQGRGKDAQTKKKSQQK